MYRLLTSREAITVLDLATNMSNPWPSLLGATTTCSRALV